MKCHACLKSEAKYVLGFRQRVFAVTCTLCRARIRIRHGADISSTRKICYGIVL